MSVPDLLNHVLHTDLPRSVQIFAPELVLCGTIIALLLVRMFDAHRWFPTSWVALLGTLAAFVGVFAQFMYMKTGGEHESLKGMFHFWGLTADGVGTSGPYFTGLLTHDSFGVFFRIGLLLFLILIEALTILTGIPDQDDGQDFYTLLIGSTLGMLMACGVNNLLMLFVAIEMMSVPSYVMVGFLKGRKLSSEAAFKYVVYGAGIAGVMLYGVSLLSGVLGTLAFPELGSRFALLMGDSAFSLSNPTAVATILGIMLVLVGVAFKLSLVPFHFWCPDAFEGASAEVAGFLSVASKAGAFALLIRFALAFQGTSPAVQTLCLVFGLALGVVSCLSMTFGNLAAYTQTNLKRLLAYSTIAHAGYMVMAVAAMMVILSGSGDRNMAAACVSGLIYYIAVYLFMNLTAFAVVAFIRNETFREDIESYNGLATGGAVTKIISVCLLIAFVSLVGLPPLAGFFGKFAIFSSAFRAGSVHWFLWVVLGLGGLNTVFSLFYYLRVLRAVFILPPADETKTVELPSMVGAYVVLITLPILALGMTSFMGDLDATAVDVARQLFHI
ncbi:MAG: NADH-quinone oxidoreductase subunit N [Planctomycetaceae bacterium]